MLFKLSRRNVKRSIKDYTVYFITLVIAVCIFYIFNSIDSQTVMMDITKTQKQYLDTLNQLLNIVSIFVSFILAFLIIYSNNFLIKRRSKEFGIYMTLGISRSKISFMLFYETLIIGTLSLCTGIFIGVFLSQGVAGVTGKLFAIDMTKYKFIFSSSACIKTITYFAIMFLVTMILNFIVVSRYKLIKLINNGKVNEKLKGINLVLSVILFIISVICLIAAYKIVLDKGLLELRNEVTVGGRSFNVSVPLGIIGTVLFFRALSGFLIKVIQSNKNYYLKNLKDIRNNKLSDNNNIKINDKVSNICKEFNLDLKKYGEKYIDYNIYVAPVKFLDLYKNTNDRFIANETSSMKDFNLNMIKLSDYNKLMEMQNKEKINLKDKEVLITTDMSTMKKTVKDYIDKNKTMQINKEEFSIYPKHKKEALENSVISGNFTTLVVNDKYVKNNKILKKTICMNYKGNKIQTEKKLMKDIEKTEKAGLKYELKNNVSINGMSKITLIEFNMASSGMYLYVGIYIGIIFLISSAAVLALSQLSSAVDSVEKYKILKKLGVSSSMVNRSIFVQILLYFMLPIALALIHSIFGIQLVNDVVKLLGDNDTIRSNVISLIIICTVYVLYLLATYKGYKNIVNKE